MALRDLGYKSYEGERLPASHNTWVLMRHGMRRAWASWFVKLAVFFFWVPPLLALLFEAMGRMTGGGGSTSGGFLKLVIDTSFWMLITLVTTGAGATVIAHDRLHRSFQFYLAKPVTPLQYLVGRTFAVAMWSFLLMAVPAVLVSLLQLGAAELGNAETSEKLETAGLILPTLLYALLCAVTTGAISIGISSLSQSRGLTTTTWLTVLLLPTVLAWMVTGLSKWPWLWLTSIWGLLDEVGDALFKIEIETDAGIEWYHALPVLLALTGGALYLAYNRVRRAEVVT
jgi:ABC-type transport system involved in multi-copper enzyme maturation permease subunit